MPADMSLPLFKISCSSTFCLLSVLLWWFITQVRLISYLRFWDKVLRGFSLKTVGAPISRTRIFVQRTRSVYLIIQRLTVSSSGPLGSKLILHGGNIHRWKAGTNSFDSSNSVEQSVREDLRVLKTSPYISKGIAKNSYGFVYDIKSGLLAPVECEGVL